MDYDYWLAFHWTEAGTFRLGFVWTMLLVAMATRGLYVTLVDVLRYFDWEPE